MDTVAISSGVAPVLRAIDDIRGRSRAVLAWSPARIAILQAKADGPKIAEFERRCARGQLAASRGEFAEAEDYLSATLTEFAWLYPANGHLFTHVLQLALALQLTEIVSLFLDDRYKAPGVFQVELGPDDPDPAINRVTVDAQGRCHFSVHPRIACVQHADYFVAHWLSGALPWAAFCCSPECEAGSIMLNAGEAGQTPGLAYCGNRPEHILIPDGYFLGSGAYAELQARYDAARPAWQDRQAMAFWRGATTGIRTGRMDWQSLPRIHLCKIGEANSADLDAGISEVVQSSDPDARAMQAAGLIKGRQPAETFLHYKYQIDIDGNSNAWPGLFQRLLTGSPVLKITSAHGYRQWYYDRLKPWINYVPVASDMSDLIDKINWLRAHDDEARTIGEAGLALARSLRYDAELAWSSRQIGAALRGLSGKPEYAYRYGAGEADSGTLGEGWDVAGTLCSAVGSYSIIRLPSVAVAADYHVCLTLEPQIHEPDVPAQRVVVAVNGQVLAEASLSTLREVRFNVSAKLLAGRDGLDIVVLHPDGFPPSRYRPTRDERVLSVAIHALSVTLKADAQPLACERTVAA